MRYTILVPLGLYLGAAYANIDFHFKDHQRKCDPKETLHRECMRGQVCSDKGK